jgi:hypothetical protein
MFIWQPYPELFRPCVRAGEAAGARSLFGPAHSARFNRTSLKHFPEHVYANQHHQDERHPPEGP